MPLMGCLTHPISGLPQTSIGTAKLGLGVHQGRSATDMADRYAAFAELVQDTLAVMDSAALSHQPGESSSSSREDKSPSRRRWQAAVDAQAALAHQDYAAAERVLRPGGAPMLPQRSPTLSSMPTATTKSAVRPLSRRGTGTGLLVPL